MLNPSRTWPGSLAGLFIAGIMLAAFLSLFSAAPNTDLSALWQDPYLLHVTLFSIKQALLSTLLSVLFAIPIAHALHRRQFFGKSWLLKLCAMTLVLPVLVGVFGLLAVYGKSGVLQSLLNHLAIEWSINIYGLSGIVLAHVLFNLPFCTQLFVQSLEQIPDSEYRLSRQLGLTSFTHFKVVEWPSIKRQIPHSAKLVFMLCFTSFATVMALGGGPQATTIELAIYQAIRFDFDLQTGALLACWQLLLCIAFHQLFHCLSDNRTKTEPNANVSLPEPRDSVGAKVWDAIWITALLALLLPPLTMIFFAGLNPKTLPLLTTPALISATENSLFIALLSSLFALGITLCIVFAVRHWRLNNARKLAGILELTANSVLVVPSVVLATGLFLLLGHYMDVFSSPFVLVIIVNSLMALPFAMNTLMQPMLQVGKTYQTLCQSLGMRGLKRIYIVEWQLLRQPLAKAFAISFVLSTGDLGAIALVGTQDFQTLPLYLFQLMGSYQMEAGAAAALVLLILSFSAYLLLHTLFASKKHRGKHVTR